MIATTRTLAALRQRGVTRRDGLWRVHEIDVILRQVLNRALRMRSLAPCKGYGKSGVTRCRAVNLGFSRRKGGSYERWRDV